LLRTEIYVLTGRRASGFLQRSINFPLTLNAHRCIAPFFKDADDPGFVMRRPLTRLTGC
jgi:hypothetical protein